MNINIAKITTIFLCGSIFSLSQGLLYPYFSQKLIQLGFTPTSIGLSAAITPIGMMIGAFFAPRILIRSSVGLAVILSSTLVGLCLIIVSYVVKPEVWHFVRFFIGFGTAVIFVSTNSLLATLVKKEKMGKIFGLYNTITSCGFAIGPLILTVDGKNLPITFLGLFILLVASIFFFSI